MLTNTGSVAKTWWEQEIRLDWSKPVQQLQKFETRTLLVPECHLFRLSGFVLFGSYSSLHNLSRNASAVLNQPSSHPWINQSFDRKGGLAPLYYSGTWLFAVPYFLAQFDLLWVLQPLGVIAHFYPHLWLAANRLWAALITWRKKLMPRLHLFWHLTSSLGYSQTNPQPATDTETRPWLQYMFRQRAPVSFVGFRWTRHRLSSSGV